MMSKSHHPWAGVCALCVIPELPRALPVAFDQWELGIATAIAFCWGVWPDIDAPRRRDRETGDICEGAIPAESHGPASRAIAQAAHDVSGGHRHGTHWALTSVVLGLLLVLPMNLWPAPTLGIVLGIGMAWPIRAYSYAWVLRQWPLKRFFPHYARREARSGAAIIGGIIGASAGLFEQAGLVEMGMLVPLAVAIGGIAHDTGDWLVGKGSGVPILGLPLPTKGKGRLAKVGRWCKRRRGLGLIPVNGTIERWVICPLLCLAVPALLAWRVWP